MSKPKATSKLNGEVLVNHESLTQCTKIEIVPVMGQGVYAITLRFCVLKDTNFIPTTFDAKKKNHLTYRHHSMSTIFDFEVDYLDMGIEDNPNFTELSIFLKGKKSEPAKSLLVMPSDKLIV